MRINVNYIHPAHLRRGVVKIISFLNGKEIKMDIFEKTRELGEMIRESKEMAEVKEAEARQEADETAQTLLQEYNLARMNLVRDMQAGKITHDEAVEKNSKLFDEMLADNEVISNYIEKKKQFDAMVGEINSILNYYITGQEPGCTHDCSSCGGCH